MYNRTVLQHFQYITNPKMWWQDVSCSICQGPIATCHQLLLCSSSTASSLGSFTCAIQHHKMIKKIIWSNTTKKKKGDLKKEKEIKIREMKERKQTKRCQILSWVKLLLIVNLKEETMRKWVYEIKTVTTTIKNIQSIKWQTVHKDTVAQELIAFCSGWAKITPRPAPPHPHPNT